MTLTRILKRLVPNFSAMVTREGSKLRIHLVALIMLASLDSACIIEAYRPIDPQKKPASVEVKDRKEFLSFFYHSGGLLNPKEELQSLPWEFQFLRDLFEHHSRFLKAVVTPSPPVTGTHINIYQTFVLSTSPWCVASILTLSVIPCYREGIVSHVHFDVYVDNALKKSYRYDISSKAANWIGLMPFIWINAITTHRKDAFAAIAYQFLSDGTRDGYF